MINLDGRVHVLTSGRWVSVQKTQYGDCMVTRLWECCKTTGRRSIHKSMKGVF